MAAWAGRCFTLAALALAIAGCAPTASHATHAQAPATTTPPTKTSARVIDHLQRPGALAVGRGGQLYLADDSLNEIVQLLPGGRFAVIAGNGRAGFCGDGGPAASACLNDPGGIAVARSGTLYFADMGNNRIRAISPSGIISTVAGNGRLGGWVPSGTPALKAGLVSPADVVIGPDRALYVADTGSDEIFKMTRAGRLILVAGTRSKLGGIWGIGRPATEASPDSPDGLAFDRAGDLFIAGWATKTLLMITASGIMKLPDGTDGFYPRGDGGLVTAPNGSVLAMNYQQIDRITPHGIQTIYKVPAHPRVGIQCFLPAGIAAAANGTIYLDTWPNGYANKTALIEIRPGGTARVLWQN